MAKVKTIMGLVLAVLTVQWAGAAAQSSCTNVLISMSPCLNFITGNSSTPSSQCCTQLASVVRTSPQCLCEVLNGGASSLGININQTQAMALPAACNVQTPSTSRCNSASPAGSPESGSTIPPGGGSKNVPSTQEDGSSNASSIKLSFSLLSFLVFAASYSSIFKIY